MQWSHHQTPHLSCLVLSFLLHTSHFFVISAPPLLCGFLYPTGQASALSVIKVCIFFLKRRSREREKINWGRRGFSPPAFRNSVTPRNTVGHHHIVLWSKSQSGQLHQRSVSGSTYCDDTTPSHLSHFLIRGFFFSSVIFLFTSYMVVGWYPL